VSFHFIYSNTSLVSTEDMLVMMTRLKRMLFRQGHVRGRICDMIGLLETGRGHRIDIPVPGLKVGLVSGWEDGIADIFLLVDDGKELMIRFNLFQDVKVVNLNAMRNRIIMEYLANLREILVDPFSDEEIFGELLEFLSDYGDYDLERDE
jgi:hypothetical protein